MRPRRQARVVDLSSLLSGGVRAKEKNNVRLRQRTTVILWVSQRLLETIVA